MFMLVLLSMVFATAHVPHQVVASSICVVRGGALNTSDNDMVTIGSTINETCNDDSENKINNKQLLHLFQLADDAKSEASTTEEDENRSSTTNVEGRRGGAMVKEKKQKPTHWLSQFTRISFTSFLERSSEDSRPAQSSERSSKNTRSVTYAKNFWLNTWVGNIPEERGDSKDDDQSLNFIAVDSFYSGEGEDSSIQLVEQTESKSKKLENVEAVYEGENIDRWSMDIKRKKNDLLSNENYDDKNVNALQINQTLQSLPNYESNDVTKIEPKEFNAFANTSIFRNRTSLAFWRKYSNVRSVRKASARLTGLHGFFSGKNSYEQNLTIAGSKEHVNAGRAKDDPSILDLDSGKKYKIRDVVNTQSSKAQQRRFERERKMRLKEIDRQILANQRLLFELASERDVLHQRPNPLWNYTVEHNPARGQRNDSVVSTGLPAVSRVFNFPPQEVVDNYLDMLFFTGRIVKMNHTALWQTKPDVEEDEDDWYFPPAKYRRSNMERSRTERTAGIAQHGSWFLRHGLGEKLSESIEIACYKAVCQSVMAILARTLSSLHGLNVMGFSEILLTMEQTPNLPGKGGIIADKGRDYTIQDAIQRGARRKNKMGATKRRTLDDSFIQRGAVVETLLIQCQTAAPLLKMFPLVWQRAILANIVTLIAAVISDFCEGVEFHILGHRLTLSFAPLTEDDLLRGLVQGVKMKTPRYTDHVRFEAAVLATATDVGSNLNLLDRWHERALGGGLVRMQIANLIARLVLTLIDDVLDGAKISLWTSHAGGPRIIAALDYTTT